MSKAEKRECCACHNSFLKYETFETVEGIMCKDCLDNRVKKIQQTDEFSLDYLNSVNEKYLDYCLTNLDEKEHCALKQYIVKCLNDCNFLKEITKEFLADLEFYNYIKTQILK